MTLTDSSSMNVELTVELMFQKYEPQFQRSPALQPYQLNSAREEAAVVKDDASVKLWAPNVKKRGSLFAVRGSCCEVRGF